MKAIKDQRKWHWLDYFLFLMRTIWFTFNGYAIFISTIGSEKWILLLWASCSYIIPHLFYRPGLIKFQYYIMTEVLLTGSLFIYLSSQHEIAVTYSFLLVPILTVAYACQVKPLIWLGPFLVVGTWAGSLFINKDFFALLIDTIIFYGIGFCLGRMTIVNNANKELIASIEEKNKHLEYYSKRIEELTIREERNRVSQDLHDTVGHIFTSVITSLDALPFLYQADKKEAEKSIKEISDLARNGLNDVRKTIHHMSPMNHQTLVESVQELIADFMKHTATDIKLNVEGKAIKVSERVKFVIIRCIQEGLTNAKRHGQSTFIKVNISFKQEELIVLIEDNGNGCDELNLGFGLRSMKDRISALAGTVNFHSKSNNGMRITCNIPIAKEV
ncbi:sensor histidine kinase [Lysinibacillus pakistanensis]|uniref:histidine kinase n=1 Tax=Lysinibacillus pakistanensis TaxID=759811 RepID=A0AAX3WZA6_9BACI|nr:sensor histidine kinase [Lysinibacillus pakistanensis]MDM5232536.1 sensor histidine kinase [Lysinibacillus pakistanensis]WHY48044.1 sensor histidine kinase [Lysinibacillus pakistanensis]WHY53056.1 sensor histidine kinase [Lysinibacillus pakistanensis]